MEDELYIDQPLREPWPRRYLELAAMKEIWQQVEPNSAKKNQDHLRQILDDTEFQSVLEAIEDVENGELGEQLAADLRRSYGSKADVNKAECPQSIVELQDRLRNKDQRHGTLGNSFDYMSQRLTSIRGIRQIIEYSANVPSKLRSALDDEEQRLARFLVALKRYDESHVAEAA